MNIITGERQSGKTRKLFEKVREYCMNNPEGEAIIISRNMRIASYMEDFYKAIYGKDSMNNIHFIGINDFKRQPYNVKTKKRMIFIDELEDVLCDIFGAGINSVTISKKGANQ